MKGKLSGAFEIYLSEEEGIGIDMFLCGMSGNVNGSGEIVSLISFCIGKGAEEAGRGGGEKGLLNTAFSSAFCSDFGGRGGGKGTGGGALTLIFFSGGGGGGIPDIKEGGLSFFFETLSKNPIFCQD
jgi:hypothetical protein